MTGLQREKKKKTNGSAHPEGVVLPGEAGIFEGRRCRTKIHTHASTRGPNLKSGRRCRERRNSGFRFLPTVYTGRPGLKGAGGNHASPCRRARWLCRGLTRPPLCPLDRDASALLRMELVGGGPAAHHQFACSAGPRSGPTGSHRAPGLPRAPKPFSFFFLLVPREIDKRLLGYNYYHFFN